MQLFYTINGWAARNALLDDAMRWFYVGAIPLLATLLAALLVFRPARFVAEEARVGRVACAAICAVAICVLSCGLVNWFSQAVLGTPILSSRPFVTHWVNALVVEPNDNAFPCVETAIIGALFLSIWAVAPKLAWPAFFYGILFCLARVFCGTNFVEDVAVGFLGGISLAFWVLSLWRVSLCREKRFPWYRVIEPIFRRLKHQAFAALFLLFSSAFAFWLFGLVWSPSRYDRKVGAFFTEKTDAILAGTLRHGDIEYSKRVENAKTATTDAPREGEGAPTTSESLIQAPTKEIPRVGVTNLGGNLPMQAAQLLSALRKAQLPHAIVDVDVASLRGDLHRDNVREEQFASVRFQVKNAGAEERKRVVQTAKTVVQIAFAQNPKLQNIDVIGVVLNAPKRDGVKYAVFSEGAIPVFSASVERAKLWLSGEMAVFNAPNSNAGLWLRARSLLYFNERVLPAKPLAAATSLFSNSTQPLVVPQTVAPTPKVMVPQRVSPQATPKNIVSKPSFFRSKFKIAPRRFSRKSSTRYRRIERPRRVYRQRFYQKYRRYRRE